MRRARDLRNGWGVCGNPGIDAGIDAYATMLQRIGTSAIRSPLARDGRPIGPQFELLRLATARLDPGAPPPRLTAIVTAYLNDAATTWAMQQGALRTVAASGLLGAIEGPNEINNRVTGGGSHGPDDHADRTGPDAYPANALAWAKVLDQFRRQTPQLRGVPLIAPSIASGLREDYARLPRLTGLVDAGNAHFYAGGGRQPGFSIPPNPDVGSFATVLGWAQAAQLPGGPMWLTETGASTSGNYARDGVSQAKYLANQFFDAFAAGAQRLYFYQLIDGSSAPGDTEGNFGLFRHDGSPKPAVAMFERLKHLLSVGRFEDPRNRADTGPITAAYDPRDLTLGGPAEALVLQKSDGSTVIAVWNEPPIDDGKGNSLAPASQDVTLDLGSSQRFGVHDLLEPAAPEFESGRRVDVKLRGHPVLVELRPGSARN